MAKRFIIGIDLGGTNLRIALLDLNYKIIDKRFLSTVNFSQKISLIRAIADTVEAIIVDRGLSNKDILGIGLGLPGPIDVKNGIVHFFPNIPGWKKVGLKRILEKRLKLPVSLDNDAHVMALAEHKLGAARGAANAVCVTLGTGVGGGIIIDGKVYRGAGNSAGEIGHIPINEDGPQCNCGGKACIESYIGNNRIMKEASRVFKREISLQRLSYLAKRGDRRALAIWSRVGRRLGLLLSGVVNFLNPDCIVIGGGVSNAGRVLFDQVKQTIAHQAMPVQARQVKILKARLGNNAGLIGAAILVKEGI